jgi:hypothetical protein
MIMLAEGAEKRIKDIMSGSKDKREKEKEGEGEGDE